MKTIVHNGCLFQEVAYNGNYAIIKITPTDGTFTSGSEIYERRNVLMYDSLEDFVKANY